ncbi:MAG: hypothetical protein ABFD84_13130 [Candidatus Polarisedimenticolia bacterium]
MAEDDLHKFGTRYFTGAQASLFVGDVWIDEVYGVQFAASQNVVPVYGYASTLFDAVARGKALTQGYFEINFVEEGYLYAALYNAATAARWSAWKLDNKGDVALAKAGVPPNAMQIGFGVSGPYLTGMSATAGATSNVTKALRIKEDLAALDKFVAPASPVTDPAAARAQAAAVAKERVRTTNALLSAIADLDVASLDSVASQMAPRTSATASALNVVYSMIPFSLSGYFGLPEEARKNGTLKVLRNCFLTSNEMVIGANDEPVKERYAFICRSHV